MTKIICTIGPNSCDKDTLRQMADQGMSMARLNFSHGSHSRHAEVINTIQQLNSAYGFRIKLLQDLEGYRIRVGRLPGGQPIQLNKDQIVILNPNSTQIQEKSTAFIPFDFQGDLSQIKKDFEIYMDDGNILLRVLSSSPESVKARVIIPGKLTHHKGINIPELSIDHDILTEKDKKDILFGIQHQVDYVALSFVCGPQNMARLREFMGQHDYECPLIAKIENREGLNNVEDILNQSDGVMIARGDLGVSIPIYEVPVMQKRIIRLCNQHQKIDITATQMLESMTQNPRPTRAEVSDVANAVLDGSDYVMLSGETAVGKYPVQTVQMMKHIIDFTIANLY
ncbi:MAG: pyruvate kinase [Candidatus Aminicenantes bacterium]|nr:pyruvate kinase [Candidatus Aminicenantes bacterium]